MTIPTLSPTPVRGDPDTFSTAFETFLSGLDPWAVAVQAVGDAADADATAAAASAATATTQAGLATTNGAAQVALATTQANNAANSATASANSALVAGAVAWVSGTTYAIGDTRYSPINFQTYRRKTTGAGTTDPSADSTNWTKALAVGINSVTTATTSTTLTTTATLLQITPASYGVAITLPDATTCSVGGPLHTIDNKGAYPVRVLNSAGTLLGFVFAGVFSHVSLADNSTASGVWTIENAEPVGASAQLLTTNMALIDSCIDIGSSQEVIIGRGVSSANCYGVVYNRSTNTFGSVTLIRTATLGSSLVAACLSGTNQVMVCSVATGAATFEAVCLSITGTTIAVGTAATATLSANINTFADGCGLIAVGSSLVCSYTVATPAAQIRALSISGTTVTIGSAEALGGTAGGLIAVGDSTHVIAVSTATTHLYTKPYLVSGSTLTAGTGTDTNSGTMTLYKLAALGTRWMILYNDGGSTCKGGVVSLTTTGNGTTAISTATVLSSVNNIVDAIVLSASKVLVVSAASSSNANILTDAAGTASAGTAITLADGGNAKTMLGLNGTDVYVGAYVSHLIVFRVDCSGASPVKTSAQSIVATNTQMSVSFSHEGGSNAVLSKTPKNIYGTNFAQSNDVGATTMTMLPRLRVPNLSIIPASRLEFAGATTGGTSYRGRLASEVWRTDGATVITKLECIA